MTPAKRSQLMGRILGKNTQPERVIETLLGNCRGACERHPKDLPGRPDFVFRQLQLAVFVDGDFWHGFRFPLWRHKLAPFWREKISATRVRDARNFAKLRYAGWKVMRIWEHQIEVDPEACAARVLNALKLLSQPGAAVPSRKGQRK